MSLKAFLQSLIELNYTYGKSVSVKGASIALRSHLVVTIKLRLSINVL